MRQDCEQDARAILTDVTILTASFNEKIYVHLQATHNNRSPVQNDFRRLMRVFRQRPEALLDAEAQRMAHHEHEHDRRKHKARKRRELRPMRRLGTMVAEVVQVREQRGLLGSELGALELEVAEQLELHVARCARRWASRSDRCKARR